MYKLTLPKIYYVKRGPDCCELRYDFSIETMFCSSLPPVVCRMAHTLFTLFVFVVSNTYCVVFLLVFVLCTLYCQFLWIVHFLLFIVFLTF